MASSLLKKGLIGGMVMTIGASTLGGSVSVATASTQFSYKVEKLGIDYPTAINNKGQIVGYLSDKVDSHAVLWEKGIIKELGTLGGEDSKAYGINNKGQIVGSADRSKFVSHAFLWDKGVMKDLGTLSGKYSSAWGINDIGQIVGASEISSTISGIYHAFLWDKGVMKDLGTLGGKSSYAVAINNNGQIVGRAETKHQYSHCVLWSEGTIKDISPRLKYLRWYREGCVATSINNRGKLGAYSDTIRAGDKAFTWYKGIPRKINLGTISGINDLGQIIGRETGSTYLLTPIFVTQ